MTNGWTDIQNATALMIFSNPAENHPGSTQWVYRAIDKMTPDANGKIPVFVIDPRRTRLADAVERRGGKHLRIRPGTDIALVNGLIKYTIEQYDSGVLSGKKADYIAKTYAVPSAGGLYAWDDGNGGYWPTVDGMVWPMFTDSLFLLAPGDDKKDYLRYCDTSATASALGITYWVSGAWSGDLNYSFWTGAGSGHFTTASQLGFPVAASAVDPGGSITVWTSAGTSAEYSLDSSSASVMTAYQYLRRRVSGYTADEVVNICAKFKAGYAPTFDADDFTDFCDKIVKNSWVYTAYTPASSGEYLSGTPYKAATIMYAMGTTQHTHGTQNIRDYAIAQLMLGNMGHPGGGVNALRGISNVQGSTDIGLLKHLIPWYSGPPAGSAETGSAGYLSYMDGLFGYGNKDTGLQQVGFKNMSYAFFSGNPVDEVGAAVSSGVASGLFDYWPKGEGLGHREMFDQMSSAQPGYSSKKPKIRALFAWGQNPVQSEGNSCNIRAGIESLELLVVVDKFYSETANAYRNNYLNLNGRNVATILLPAAGFAEKCGTLTTSSRVIQWKWQVAEPKGNCKQDAELLAMLAYKLAASGLAVGPYTPATAWNELWRDPYFQVYDYGTSGFLSGTRLDNPFDSAMSGYFKNYDHLDMLRNNQRGYIENIFREYNAPMSKGGASWLYQHAWSEGTAIATYGYPLPAVPAASAVGVPSASYSTYNRAQSRNNSDPFNYGIYRNWGFAWLLNRRIFYNRGFLSSFDTSDLFVNADKVAQIFVHDKKNKGYLSLVDYSTLYRKYKPVVERDGRTPKHYEPTESPRPDLVATYSPNPDAVPSVMPYGESTNYPLILSTHRYVDHQLGGQMTRNVPYLVELTPEPILEISPIDAATYGLADGGEAIVRTARSQWTATHKPSVGANEPYMDSNGWVGPFRVRIEGVGTKTRVTQGHVAVPFHWGSTGYSQGAAANLLTNDAGDANTAMPETKVCLCAIYKKPANWPTTPGPA